MNVLKFRTAQEILPRTNVCPDKSWLLGIDAGFSSLKGFAPNKVFCFPSYVKKIEEMLLMSNEEDILYKDETGLYLVGMTAQEQVSSDDTSDTESELFSRNRYSSKKFQIIIMTGIAIGLMDDPYMERDPTLPIKIQTGLPTAYLKKDSPSIIKAFAKESDFQIKIGYGQWQHFHIQLDPANISVMAQPSGTLYSVVIDENGHYLPDTKNMFMKNIMIVDAGFGTFDPYGLMNRKLVLQESLPNLGMKRILEETAGLIYEKYKEDIRVPVMQKYLGKGYFSVFHEEQMTTEDVTLAPFLETAVQKVGMESVEALKSMSNFMRDYEYLIPTGGTGQVWYDLYKEHFKGMKNLSILPGNRNDKLPMYYSNVRGYYMLRYMLLKNEESGHVH